MLLDVYAFAYYYKPCVEFLCYESSLESKLF